MKITLKGVPPSLNTTSGRNNCCVYRKAKQIWTEAVYIACIACQERPKTPYQRAMVRIDYFFPDRRRRDPDNYSGKFLLDGLTKAEIILDDDFKHISLSQHGFMDREQPRTELHITEVPKEMWW